MENQLKTINNQKVFFTVKEDSNYKVMMTYDREEIIEYGQFVKLFKTLNAAEVVFVTINQRVVNKSTIIDISPTNERTKAEKEILEKKNAQEKREQMHRESLAKLKEMFNFEFFNEKYGKGNWKRFTFAFDKDKHKHILTEGDIQGAWVAFKKKYPAEAKEIEDLQEII